MNTISCQSIKFFFWRFSKNQMFSYKSRKRECKIAFSLNSITFCCIWADNEIKKSIIGGKKSKKIEFLMFLYYRKFYQQNFAYNYTCFLGDFRFCFLHEHEYLKNKKWTKKNPRGNRGVESCPHFYTWVFSSYSRSDFAPF